MALELRRIKGDIPRLKRDGRRIVWLPTVIAVPVGLANSLGVEGSFRVAEQAGQVILALIVLSLTLMLAVNTISVLNTVAIFSDEIRHGAWDILQLTNVNPQFVLEAKYVGAQLRLWWPTCLEISLRAVTIALASAPLVVAFLLQTNTWFGTNLLSILLIGFLTSIYIFEPFWRMRMIAALGLALAAFVRRASDGMLIGMIFILAISLMQLGALVAIIIVREVSLQSGFVFQCFVPMVLIIIFMVSGHVYTFVRYRSLEFTLRRAFQPEVRDS